MRFGSLFRVGHLQVFRNGGLALPQRRSHLTDRARYTRRSRWQASAMALKTSEVVAARSTTENYIPMWECVKPDSLNESANLELTSNGGAHPGQDLLEALD
jgi:hypothetical protein